MYTLYLNWIITSTNGHLPKGKVKLDAYKFGYLHLILAAY